MWPVSVQVVDSISLARVGTVKAAPFTIELFCISNDSSPKEIC